MTNKILIFGLVLLLTCYSAIAVDWSDDCNRPNNNDWGNGWYEEGTYINGPYLQTNRCRMPGDNGDQLAYHNLSGNIGEFQFTFKYSSDNTQRLSSVVQSNNVTTLGVYFKNLAFYNMDDTLLASGYSINTDYTVSLKNINYNTKSFDFYIDGVLKNSSVPFDDPTHTVSNGIRMFMPVISGGTWYTDDYEVTYVIISTAINTNYTTPVHEDSTTEHTLTFEDYNTTSDSTATLYWNGTEYYGTINYTAWNLTEFNTNVNIPITYSNNTAYDFYWEYNLTHNNGTQIISNTSIEQQNVLWNLTKFPRVNVTARDLIGSTDIQNFTITGGLNTPSTTNGEVYIRWNSTETVNLTFSGDGYATMSEQVNFISGNFSSHQFQIYTTNSINFTIRDEITDALITDEVLIEFISDVASYNYTTSTGSKYVDLVTPANYTIRYSSDNYDGPRHVYLTVNNNTFQEQTLYLLNSTIGTETTFVVYDATTLTKLEGAVVSVQRYNQLDNVYTLIGSYTTDISGSAFFDLEHDTELYKILVEYPLGTLKYTSSPMYITSATNNIYIDLYEDPTTTYFNSKDITFSLDYVSATTTIDTTWVDSSAIASNYCLYVKKYGQYSNEVINSSCTTSNSGSISLGGLTENTTYYGVLTATIGGEETNLGVVWQTFQGDQLDSGAFGVFMTILLFTIFAFLSMIHSYSVILAGTSLIFAKLLGILAIGWPMIITVLIGSIVLVIIVEMKK